MAPVFRPDEHAIGRDGLLKFLLAVPRGWAKREQPAEDYGVDAEVEVFEDERSTGFLIKAQVKGTEGPRFLADGQTISFSLRVDHAVYFTRELKAPLVLVLVDVSTGRMWWQAPQLDGGLQSRLPEAEARGQETIVVHINADNELPATWEALLRGALEAEVCLSIRPARRASPETLMGGYAAAGAAEAVAAQERGLSYARLARIEELWARGDWGETASAVRQVIEDEASVREVRFAGWLYVEKLEVRRARLRKELDDLPNIERAIAEQLTEVAASGPAQDRLMHLRCYAAFAVRCARLHRVVQDDFYLFLNATVHRAEPGRGPLAPLWGLMASGARDSLGRVLLREYRRCRRLLDLMVHEHALNVFAPCVVRLVIAMALFEYRLRAEGMREAAALLEAELEGLGNAAVIAATISADFDSISDLAVQTAALADGDDDASIQRRLAWSNAVAARIPEEPAQDRTIEAIQESLSLLRTGARAEIGEEDNLEAERQIYIGMASAMDVDPQDPGSELARLVRIGLQDLDPGRALRPCCHLYVTLFGTNLIASTLRMPSAANKLLCCTLHGHRTGAPTLDGASEGMNSEYCTQCRDRDPHPDGWVWTRAWQREQDALNAERFRVRW